MLTEAVVVAAAKVARTASKKKAMVRENILIGGFKISERTP